MIGNLTTAALFQAEYHQVVRITVERDSALVIYAVLSDNTEQAITQVVLSDNTVASIEDIYLDNDPYHISDANILQGGMSVDAYSMTGDRIEIGSAIASELTLNLKNSDGLFDPMVFAGRELFVEVGTKDWSTNDPITYIPIGYFMVDNEPKNGEEIKITALDRMASKFDVEIDWTQFTFPMTVQTLVSTVCTVCGVTCVTDLTTLPNYNYSITMSPEGICTMYRDLIQWAAFLTATCAQFDENGNLRFRWYTSSGFSLTTANRFDHDIEESNITLTGIHYIDNNGIEYLSGTADYTLEASGVGILQNNVETALGNIVTALNGFSYRPFEATIVTAPFLQPLDMVSFTDARGNIHNCIISHVNYLLNGSTMVAGKGDTKVTTEYATQSGLTSQQTIAVDDARRQATNYLAADETGIMVANMTDGHRYLPSTVPAGIKNTFVDDDSFDVRDGQTILASFGETVLIGKDEEGNLRTQIGAGAFRLVDTNNDSLVNIEYAGSGFYFDPLKYHFDFGSRADGSRIGDWSFIAGKELGACMANQFACGKYNGWSDYINDTELVSSDDPTMTIDVSDWISRGVSEGDITVKMTSGVEFTWELVDTNVVITIIREGNWVSYYIAHVYSWYTAFAVGNGTSDTDRSNAFAVTWDGNALMALDTTATSGTTDGDLYNAITALGWESEVIT